MFYHRISVEIGKIRYSSKVTPPRSSALRTETFVREIRLYSKYESSYRDTSLAAVARFLSRFPFLETLTICSLNWDLRSDIPSCWDWTRPRPSITVPSVKKIIMVYRTSFPSFDKLRVFLDWFPCLEELEFLKDSRPGQSIHHDVIPPGHSYVQFQVECSQSLPSRKHTRRRIIHGLKSLFALSLSAQVLIIDLDTEDDVENAALVLSELGTSLRELTFNMTTEQRALQRTHHIFAQIFY